MRSIFLVLSACGVAHAAECQAADEATMLQLRNLAHVKKQKKGAQAVLRSLQNVAIRVQSMKKDDVDDALAAADAALQQLSPAIQEQVGVAQQQVDDAGAAVMVCHSQDGYNTRATLSEDVDVAATNLQTCQSDLEGLTGEANAQCAIAEDCLCDEANERVNGKTETCAALTEVYEALYCEHNLACSEFGSCHANEMSVYNTLIADVDAEIASLQQEYIATEQSTCLMALIMTAMASGTPIDATAMVACNVVDASAIAVNYPELPANPDGCPAAAVGTPTCAHFHFTADGCGTNNYGLAQGGGLADVRCCSMDASDCMSDGFEGGVVDPASPSYGDQCIFAVTYQEAMAICANVGRRLCTEAEKDVCCNTGCSHNAHAIWIDP